VDGSRQGLWLVFGLILSWAPTAQGQLAYGDFSSVAGLTLNGSAAQIGNVLQLNPASGNQAGTVWADMRQQVAGGFLCQFTFRITRVGGGADGMSFIIHDDPAGTAAIAQAGGSLAYTSMPFTTTNSMQNLLVIELDTYINGWPVIPDSSNNEISVHLYPGYPTSNDGADEVNSIGRTTPTVNFSDGAVHTLTVLYVPGLLEIYLDAAASATLSVPFDFNLGGTGINGQAIGGLTLSPAGAYVGFTGTTGGLVEINEVLSFSFTGSAPTNDYQVNSLAAYLAVDGVQGTSQIAAMVTLGLGVSGNLTLGSSNIGAMWDLAFTTAPLLPASGGGLVTGSGQIINLDTGDPSFGSWFNLLSSSPPFGGLNVAFAIPTAAAVSAQFGIVDPSFADGIAISQPTRLVVQ